MPKRQLDLFDNKTKASTQLLLHKHRIGTEGWKAETQKDVG